MENASKALIIAGAILLSILIIGLGMTVYNSSTSVTGSINLDSQELGAHNSQFLAYEGRQKGSQVKTLLTAIQSNNNEYDDRQISVSASTTSSVITIRNHPIYLTPEKACFYLNQRNSNVTSIRDSIKSNTTYKVSFDYADNGLLDICIISVYSATGNTI